MIIDLKINDTCNFNCSYCDFMKLNKLKHHLINYDVLLTIIKQFPKSTFFIYGGEPTMHPKFNELISFLLSQKISDIIVQTNGTFKINKKFNIKINYSYHPSQIAFTDFLKNIDSSRVNEIAFMDEDDKYFKYYSILKKMYKNVQFCPIIDTQNFDNKPLTSDRLISLSNKPIWNSIKKDYHFINNYNHWKNKETSNYNNKCHINNFKIFTDGISLYCCINDQIRQINKKAIDFFNNKPFICKNKNCFFDFEYWEK